MQAAWLLIPALKVQDLYGVPAPVPHWSAKTRYLWRGSLIRFMDGFSPNFLPMTDHLNPSTSRLGNRSEKSGFLSLSQISELMAQGAVSQHQMLSEAHSSQVYATELDEFVDFHAWQSVNVNPSIEQGVHP